MGNLPRLHSQLPLGVLNPFPVEVTDALAHEVTTDHEVHQHLTRTRIHLHKLGAWLRRSLQHKLLGAWGARNTRGGGTSSDEVGVPCGSRGSSGRASTQWPACAHLGSRGTRSASTAPCPAGEARHLSRAVGGCSRAHLVVEKDHRAVAQTESRELGRVVSRAERGTLLGNGPGLLGARDELPRARHDESLWRTRCVRCGQLATHLLLQRHTKLRRDQLAHRGQGDRGLNLQPLHAILRAHA
eukprot:scaffold17053_cov78-Phaeocystis_antarctica.AAC.5